MGNVLLENNLKNAQLKSFQFVYEEIQTVLMMKQNQLIVGRCKRNIHMSFLIMIENEKLN